jgi:hypothetical protein
MMKIIKFYLKFSNKVIKKCDSLEASRYGSSIPRLREG